MATELKECTIGVIGAGVMGQTLIQGMLDANLIDSNGVRAAVQTAASKEVVASKLGVEVAAGGYPEDWIGSTDVFLICTKPYRVIENLDHLKASGKLKPGAVFISIAAGVTIEAMESRVPGFAVIRAMPNTPCRIRAGATVLAPGKKATAEHLRIASTIFSSVGTCIELAERHMDAVTAVSGSGPAYAYLIMEALADGAVKVGLPRDVAFELVSQTMMGSALMLQQSGKHPAMLKDEVTTPSGCTISALMTLEDGKIRSTLARAVEEATRTAAGLG